MYTFIFQALAIDNDRNNTAFKFEDEEWSPKTEHAIIAAANATENACNRAGHRPNVSRSNLH